MNPDNLPSWWERYAPCPACNAEGDRGSCGDLSCDLCVFATDCRTCDGTGWIEAKPGEPGLHNPNR